MEKPAFPLSMSEHDVLATQRLTSSRPPAPNALPLPGLSPQQVLPQFRLQVLPQFRLQVLPQFRFQFLPQPHSGFFLSSASSFPASCLWEGRREICRPTSLLGCLRSRPSARCRPWRPGILVGFLRVQDDFPRGQMSQPGGTPNRSFGPRFVDPSRGLSA